MPEHRERLETEKGPASAGARFELVAGGLPEGSGVSERQLRTLIDSVRAGVLMEDEECRIILANRAFCSLLEVREEPEALIGWETETALEAIRERFLDPEAVLLLTRQLVEGRVGVDAQEVALADGRMLELDYIPIFHGDRYGGHYLIFRDISAHKAAQERLRASGERLRVLTEVTARLDPGGEVALVDALGVLAGLLDLDVGLVCRLSDGGLVAEHAYPPDAVSACSPLGPLEGALGRVLSRVGGEVLALRSVSELCGDGGAPADGETPGACLAAPVEVGGRRWGVLAFFGHAPRESEWTEPDRDLARLFALWLGKSVERRGMDRARQESEARYRDFVENSAALICIHDLEGTILEVNRAVVEVLGRKGSEEIVGRSLTELVEERFADEVVEYLERIARTGEVRGTFTVVDGEGRRRWLSFANSLRREGVERPVVRGLGQDITDQFRAQAELRERMNLETILGGISASFINLPTAAVDQAIENALAELGRTAGGDVCLVFQLDETRTRLVRTHGWLAPGAPEVEPPQILPTAELPALFQTIGRLAPYRVERREELAPLAASERQHFERYGIRSFLAVPMATRGELLGFVGLVSLQREIAWREEFVSVFRLVGDIIGGVLDRKVSEEALADAHRRLEASHRELARHNGRMALLNEMGDLLQTSSDIGEAHRVIEDLVPQICPGDAGAVYLFGDDSRMLEAVVTWGEPTVPETLLETTECWALRRGRPYSVEPGRPAPRCRHVSGAEDGRSLCIPLLAQGEALGLLHVRAAAEGGEGGDESWSPGTTELAVGTAEHMALWLANLKLRESLRGQAIRDPLTGLYNRRFLEDQFAREVRRAERRGSPVSLLMIDLDHFKRVNDTYGHEAGDAVLKAVADLLVDSVRGEDLVARYGGEELTVLLADADLEQTVLVAEALRAGVETLSVSVGGSEIDRLSISVGVASYPDCGGTPEDLLASADRALYRAKGAGRNRVMVAGSERDRLPGAGAETDGPRRSGRAGIRRIG